MLEIDLDKIIENIFTKDLEKNGEATSISEITTIVIKSLFPNEIQSGNLVDYRRFKEELALWKYYITEADDTLNRILEDQNNWDYFKYRDDSLYTRILPIIITNPDFKNLEKEGIKNILFTTGDLKLLWSWIGSIRIIHSIIEKKENIIEDLKAYIINLSQVYFLKEYEGFYRFPLSEYPGNFNIQFEREKINIINILNDIDIQGYEELKDLLNIIKGENSNTILGSIILNSQKNMDRGTTLPKFYINLNDYVLKLRKSRINPEDLRIDKYQLPDIFSFEEGEVFFHSLIKDGKVIKKELRNNVLSSLVQTRSGMYLFKREPL